MELETYCKDIFTKLIPQAYADMPWKITENLEQIVFELLDKLPEDYDISGGVAIHSTAIVDPSTLIKAPAIIGKDCFVGPHGLVRGGVILGEKVSIGANCEVKQSVICEGSALGHFNYVGNSVMGADVNMEAGAVVANYYNERKIKEISVLIDGKPTTTGVTKFGAVIGDKAKIGANAVLSPGTVLPPKSIVKRLELVEQNA